MPTLGQTSLSPPSLGVQRARGRHRGVGCLQALVPEFAPLGAALPTGTGFLGRDSWALVKKSSADLV